MKGLCFNRRQFFNLLGIGMISSLLNQPQISFAQARKEKKMTYTAKDYNTLLNLFLLMQKLTGA
jgi:hypothetical protein